ncbi:PAS domain S-box protein [Paenibacillus psychroresistens]|uniref:histidine kinase n=1 Tax=Paenibacillus psychroresistens TaxID=1778678 RepID=A0A6B8REK6_9BACL|nr:PAS domain S-box protein [Paenibacillus psychroresistens]QGQ93985.1 PAS domain S-box protein [Paenibacillus psychroresistens]
MSATDKLILSNDQFKAIVELCPEPIAIYCDNIVEYLNPACMTMIGASHSSEVLGKNITDFLLPEDIEKIMLQNEELLRAGRPSDLIEKRWVRLDGQVIIVEVRSVPITYGARSGIQLFCRDITQKRRIEAALFESEQRLYSMLQHSPEAIVVHFKEKINYVNNAALKLFRASSHEQMIGKSIYDLIHIDSHNLAAQRIDLLKNSMQKLDSTIHTMVGLDGKIFSAEVSSNEIFNPMAEGHVQTVLRDVSERVQLEQALRESSLAYQNLIKNLPEPILVLDNDIIVYTNISCCKLLKAVNEDELIGKNVYQFIPPDQHEYATEIKNEILTTGKASAFIEGRILDVLGCENSIEISSTQIVYQSKPHMLCVLRDLTERKNAEERFVRSEKLSAIGQLAAGVAHEIRNPLTALKGFTRLLQKELGDKFHYLSIMQSELERINTIVNEFMSLSKPHLSHFSDGNISTILQGVVSILDTQAILRNVIITLKDSNVKSTLYCNENQLKQVFINIITNAMDAMPKGGQIYITIQLTDDAKLLIRIQDEGQGISEDIIRKIGEPFFTTKDTGTGLGLMICHRIVEAHGGKINLTSQVNVGTTVDILFPLFA